MSTAKINRFIQIFSDAFTRLDADVPMPHIERLAILIHRAMENRTRKYHTSMHIFELCEGLGARPTLAALFHDLVYYQLDGCFPQQTHSLLSKVCHLENGGFILQEMSHDPLATLCAEIFNFKPYQALPLYGGMNEFLSAVVAVRLLKPYLPLSDLIAIVACIEATIPFRATDTNGCGLLEDKIRQQCKKRLEIVDDAQCDEYVTEVMHEAISLSNVDVGGFAEANPSKFLSSTWLLIEESNTPLNAVGVYTLQDYRMALLRMEKFLHGLKADVVFHQYAGVPDTEEYQRLSKAAHNNIMFSCDFLAAKLTSIALIEAMAVETGGDCPVSMFLGDIHSSSGTKPERAEDYLPLPHDALDIRPELLQVFEQGRSEETELDLNASPLTAFLYRCLGHQGTLQAWKQAQRFFSGELSSLDFLKSLDPKLVIAMTEACMHIAISRKEELQHLHSSLSAAAA
ncbi:hypothetical protein [Iodobacter fluviatilis]|uniref:Uncharacterized protein n=1 Tax=Iodobacter fluviatilis TaxID=537 RepID=A0A377Q9F9_9NEIS|nr:hypothetical protein [Iodobacter fluviatilis]TCU81807.1 hypothetical protein EV682_11964 [Iodobacter fluviatilis]STQ91914.1 Uncharacterised protein [Iodobacter fluviatilis]